MSDFNLSKITGNEPSIEMEECESCAALQRKNAELEIDLSLLTPGHDDYIECDCGCAYHPSEPTCPECKTREIEKENATLRKISIAEARLEEAREDPHKRIAAAMYGAIRGARPKWIELYEWQQEEYYEMARAAIGELLMNETRRSVKRNDCCDFFERKEPGGYNRCLVCKYVMLKWEGVFCEREAHKVIMEENCESDL